MAELMGNVLPGDGESITTKTLYRYKVLWDKQKQCMPQHKNNYEQKTMLELHSEPTCVIPHQLETTSMPTGILRLNCFDFSIS